MQRRSSPADVLNRLVVWSSTPAGLGALFAIGFAIRLILAGGGGFPYDISSFAGWAGRLAERGPWNFYPDAGEKFFVDYPPGYLYVLWGLGKLTQALGGGAPSVFWLKLPAIVADLGLAWLIAELASRLAPAGVSRRFDIRGPAAAAVLLNPAVFFISAVWGQVDVFLALLVAGGLLLLGTGTPTFRREAAGIALLAAAFGTKPQGAFALPMVVLFLCWRHIRSRVVEADRDALARAVAGGAGRVAALGAVGVVTGFVMLAPFRLGPAAAFDFYARASSTYPVTSVFAFNGWGIAGFWRPDSGPDAVRIFGLPALAWGLALFSLGAAMVLARAWQSLRTGEDEGRVLVFGSAAITMVGFAVLTRVHERYLFLPLTLLAVFVGVRWLRRAFVALSVLYLINVFFPYVYYLRFVGRPAPSLGGLFDGFYGGGTTGIQLKILSALTTVACLVIAARGWRALEAGVPASDGSVTAPAGGVPAVPTAKPPWSLHLHPVGRRGALVAAMVFGIALLTRLPGLGHPPGMYFDEVYHARTAAEYLAKKEVFEWTHPPLAKELIALSIDRFSGFGARGGGELPQGVIPTAITSSAEGFHWVERTGSSSRIHSGRLDRSCSLRRTLRGPPVAVVPRAVATDVGPVFIGGTSADLNIVVRADARGERWRAEMPGVVDDVAAIGDRAFVLTTDDELVFVSADGEARTLASGAGALAAEPGADARRGETQTDERVAEALPSAPTRDGIVWVSFPGEDKVVAWDADGRRSMEINVSGAPTALTAPDRTERLIVATGNEVTVLDSKKGEVAHRISGGADRLSSVPETEIAWAASGRRLRAIEPRSGAVIGTARLVRPATSLVPDTEGHRLVAATPAGLECASGRPQFAWRLGSAIAGSALIALVALLALRLFGNVWLAGLASLFVAVEGLAFTMSRIAIPES
ncbi:MAG: phospholipid carrier-dependent glycosyltransferase, partial [Actinomycetota bacterium]